MTFQVEDTKRNRDTSRRELAEPTLGTTKVSFDAGLQGTLLAGKTVLARYGSARGKPTVRKGGAETARQATVGGRGNSNSWWVT